MLSMRYLNSPLCNKPLKSFGLICEPLQYGNQISDWMWRVWGICGPWDKGHDNATIVFQQDFQIPSHKDLYSFPSCCTSLANSILLGMIKIFNDSQTWFTSSDWRNYLPWPLLCIKHLAPGSPELFCSICMAGQGKHVKISVPSRRFQFISMNRPVNC